MSNEELREKARLAIDRLPTKALAKLVELLEELKILPEEQLSDEALIDRVIEENKDALARLAK
jgi:hypothetical protein